MKKKIIGLVVLIIAIALIFIAIQLHSNSNIKIYNIKNGKEFSESGLTIDIHGFYQRDQLSKEFLIDSNISENIAENMISRIKSNSIIILEFSEQENQTINELYFDYVVCDENQNILGANSNIYSKDYNSIKKAASKLLLNTSNVRTFDEHTSFTEASYYMFDNSNKVYSIINMDYKVDRFTKLKVLVINPKYKKNNGEIISFDNTIIELNSNVTQ